MILVCIIVNAHIYPTHLVSSSWPRYRYDMVDCDIYAKKMAAKAARPAIAIELPVVLAAPLKAWMGEVVGLETALS